MPPPTPGPDNSSCNLSSHPPQWQEVICYAKWMFRAYIAGKNGFPDTVTGVKETWEYLEEALAIHLKSGATVKSGELNICVCICSNNYIIFRPSGRLRHDNACKYDSHTLKHAHTHPLTTGLCQIMATSFPAQGRYLGSSLEPQILFRQHVKQKHTRTPATNQGYCQDMGEWWVLPPWHCSPFGLCFTVTPDAFSHFTGQSTPLCSPNHCLHCQVILLWQVACNSDLWLRNIQQLSPKATYCPDWSHGKLSPYVMQDQ